MYIFIFNFDSDFCGAGFLRVLIIEDQNLIGKAIEKGLTEEGYAVDWVNNLMDGLHLAREIEYDAVILDLMLPDGSGFEVLKGLRDLRSQTPVIILTAKDDIADKIQAFQLGTDDYLTKPFVFEELLLRIGALIRRKYQIYGQSLRMNNLDLDLSGRVARVEGEVLKLTAKEFAVLELFLLKRGKILSRQKIAEHIYAGDVELESNVINVFINRLRRKLEGMDVDITIEMIRGEGYVVR